MLNDEISFKSIEGIHRDIELAKKEMKKNPIHLLCPDALVKMEIYCIPSHNHHAFYLQLCKDIHNNHEVVKYARTEINDFIFGSSPIYMYTFADVIATHNKNRYSGKVVCGFINVDEDLHELFSNIKKALPKESRTNINNDGLMIDGVLHWIRYEEAGTVKEYRYFNAESLLTKSEYSSEKIEILDVHNEIIEHYF